MNQKAANIAERLRKLHQQRLILDGDIQNVTSQKTRRSVTRTKKSNLNDAPQIPISTTAAAKPISNAQPIPSTRNTTKTRTTKSNLTSNVTSNAVSSTRTRKIADSKKEIIDEEPKIENKPKIPARKAIADQQPNTKQTYFSYSRKNIISTEEKAQAPKVQTRASNLNNNNITNNVSTKYSQHKQKLEIKPETKPIIERNNNISLTSRRRTELKRNVEAVPSYEFRQKNPEPTLNAKIRNEKVTEAYTRIKPTTINVSDSDSSGSSDELIKQAAAFLSRAKKPSPNSTLTSRVDISPSQSPVSSQRNLAPSFNNKSPSPQKESSNAPFSWGNMLKESINESKVLIKNTQNKNKPSFDNDNESDSIVTNSTKQINPIKDQSPHNNYQYSSQSNKQNPVQISTQNRFHANNQTNTSDNSEIDFIFTPQKDQHNEIENKFDDHNDNLDAENEESPYIKQIKSRIHHSKPPIQKQSWKDFLPEEKLQKEETTKEPVLKSKKTTGIPKFVPKKKQRMFESSDSTSVDEFLRLEETTKDNNSNEEQPKHVKKFVSTIQKKVANIFNTDSNDKSQSSDVLPEFEEERHFVSKSKIISKNQPINYENESESINISESEDEKPLPQVSVVRNPNSRFSQFIQKTESNSPQNNQLSRFAQSTTKQFNSPKNSDTNNNKTSKFSNEDDEDNNIEIIMEDSNVSASVKINNISKSTSSPTVSSKTNSSSNNSFYNYRNSNNIEDEVEEMPGFTITNNSKSPIQAIQEFQALKQSVLDSLQEDEEITKAALKINPKSNPKLNSNLSPTSFSISNTFQTKSPIHTETNLTIQDDDDESDGIPVPKTILPKPETKYTSSFLNNKFTPSTSIPTSITTITSSDDDGSDDDIPISKKPSQQKSVSTHDFSTSENDDEISIPKKKSPQLENKFASNLLNSKFNNHINNAGSDSEDDIPIPKKTTPHSETKFDTDFLNNKFTDDSDDSIPVPKKKSPQPETKFDQNLLNSSSDGENDDIPIPKRKIPQPEKSVNDMILKVDSEEEETNSIHQPNNLPTTENNIIQNSIIDNGDELSDFIPQPKKLPKPEIMLYSNLKNTETKDNNSYDSLPKPKTSPKPEKKPYNNISNYQLDDSNSDTRSYTSKQSFQKITTKDSFEENDEEETLPESKPLTSKQYQFSDDSSDIEQTVNLKHENNYEISSDEELDPKLNNAQNKDVSIWDSKVYSDSNIEIYDDTNEARENVKTFNNSASGSPSITKSNNNNKIVTHLEEEEEEDEDSFIARHKYAKSAIANLNRTKKQSSMFSNLSSENMEKEEINKEDEKYSEEEEELVSSKVTNNDISEISLKNDNSSFKDPSPSPLALTQKAQSPKSPLRQIVQQMAETIGFDLNDEEEEPVDSYFLNSDAKSTDDFDDSHADDLMKRIDNAISKSESLITDTIKSTAKPLSEDINHSSNEIESHNSQVLTNFTQENEEEIKEAITKKKEIDYEKIDFESIKNKIYNDDDFSKKFGLSDDDEEEDEILAKIQKGRNFNFSDEKMKLSSNFLNHSDNSEEEDEILSRLKEKSQKFIHRQKEGDNEEEEFNESDKETEIEEEDVEEKVQNSKIKNKLEDNNQDKIVGKDDDEPILKIDTIKLTADKDRKIEEEEEEDLFNFNEDEPSLNQNESSFALDFLHQKDFLEPIRRNINKTPHSKQTENELESEEEESFQFNQNKSNFDELEEEEIHEFQNLDILNSQNEQQKLQNNSIVSNSDEFIKRLQEENSKNNLIASDDDDNEFLKKLRSFRDDYTSSKVKKVTTTDLNEDEEEEEIDERTQTHVQMDSDDYIIHTENRKTHGSSVKSSPVGKFLSDSQQNNDKHESKIDENEDDDEYDSDNILRELQKRIAIGSNNALSKKKSYLDSDSDDDENDKEVEEFQRKTRELIEKNDQNNLNDNDFTNKQTFNIQALKTEIRGMNFTDLDIDNSDIDLNSSDMNEKGDDNLDKEIDDFINLKDSDSDDDISI
ncbi:hypothetical protein TRFO_10640 [Tritrichomonas foetus]|uniref:Uncharacterized protein n=1 Tax=Tritrichomonas foetus TaxID=1144522 RepID=A0A1J4JAA2_9EUKA|nr:hypothetical protein TRFO_10640 [Tritrichomonas foetus]|eukprot:OHS95159.1 hypothetical protein TRFO_10640 [Tritrichomonas foetus]